MSLTVSLVTRHNCSSYRLPVSLYLRPSFPFRREGKGGPGTYCQRMHQKFSVKLSGYYQHKCGLCTYTAMYGENIYGDKIKPRRRRWLTVDFGTLAPLQNRDTRKQLLSTSRWLLHLDRVDEISIARSVFLSLQILAFNQLWSLAVTKVVNASCFNEGRDQQMLTLDEWLK